MMKKRKTLVSHLRLAEVVQLALEALLSSLNGDRVMPRIVVGDQGDFVEKMQDQNGQNRFPLGASDRARPSSILL